ncbi:MAG: hypothetical protein VYC32_00365 [Planctomycetota bacterium]|nr:hypothetical protein [Planctomycetota bacterium]MEC9031391.1 hypothetical protein [Planctomycetota bacterium]MEC9349886.1 hypothetical protein [Planctomycetota bacterium]MEE3297835.1 hypothetical protein [Planctomycetota bacterium]
MMRDLNARFIAAVMLSCLALQAGLSAQEDAPEAKPGEDKPAERAEDRQRPETSGSRRINPMAKLLELMDPDGDGTITARELDGFIAKLDSDGDKRVNDDELRVRMRAILSALRPGSSGGRSGFGGRSRGSGGRQRRSIDDPGVSRESAEASNALKQATRSGGLPGPGDRAPDFRLSLLEGSSAPDHVKPDEKGLVRLSQHQDKKPVVLIFGSYT